jgi:hypothetical protein
MLKKKYVGKIILTDDNGNTEVKWQKKFVTKFFAEVITKIKFALVSTFDFDFVTTINAEVKKIEE